MNTEKIIFANLINNEEFGRSVLPFLKEEYFHNPSDAVVFKLTDDYVQEYNAFPTKETLLIELNNKKGIPEGVFQEAKETIEGIPAHSLEKLEWLLTTSEQFCQDKAIFNALRESIKIVDESSNDLSKGSIPQLMSDALAVSFDVSIGHDFLEGDRFDFYHRREERIPFDIELLNKITKGGLPRKAMLVLLGGTGTGKTLAMCHMAAANISHGENVLYITMEMAEEKIAERIDANLLDVTVDELYTLSKESYQKKIERLKEKTPGKLIIKEYPTACAGSNNFRHLLNELRIKKNFIPDVVYIDYLNICASSRIKQGATVNSYTYVKSIAEELRGLAVEHNISLITASQLTRSGFSNSDADLTDISESFAVGYTADMILILLTSEELEEQGKMMVKQLKNRYNDLNYYKKFLIGVDKSRMKFYNLETSEDDQPVFDNTPSGDLGMTSKPKFDKTVFDGFR